MRLSFLLIFLLLSAAASAQLDQSKLDSLQQSMLESQRTLTQWQDSFTRRQDSIYRAATNRPLTRKEEKEKLTGSALQGSGAIVAAYVTWFTRNRWWP